MHAFSKIIGNENLIRAMQTSVSHNRVGHAYIIDGSAGSGKRLLSLAFAKAILCGRAIPCDACASCKTLESGNHPDIIFVRPTKKSLGVDDIREQIVGICHIKPFSSVFRIFIIENAETMTIPAQNALLKTLEDGPKHAIFFLLSKNSGVFLPTVISRCVTYKTQPIAQNVVEEHLAIKGFSRETARLGASHGAGSVGRAMAIAADDNFLQLRDDITQIADEMDSADIPTIFASAKAMEAHKDRIGEALDIMALHFRKDVLACDDDEIAAAQAIKKIRIIEGTRQKLNQNCNFLLAMEVMLLKMAGLN